MTIYCLLNSNHRLTGPVPGRASPAVRGVLIWDTPIDVPRLKQVNWLVNYVAWEILLIWNLLYRIWKNYWWCHQTIPTWQRWLELRLVNGFHKT